MQKLHDLQECAEALSKLNKTNMEKDTDLAKMRTNSNNVRNRLHVINNDIQTLEKENIRLTEEIQYYLVRQNYDELGKFKERYFPHCTYILANFLFVFARVYNDEWFRK